MLLSDVDIATALAAGRVSIEPWTGRQALQPASVDLHLGREFRWFSSGVVLDPGNPASSLPEMEREVFGDEAGEFELYTGQFVLAHTVETVKLGTLHAARVEGKSTLGRCGLSIHATAGFIDPGFSGQITLELFNQTRSTIILRPGMPIAQLCLFALSSMANRAYGSPDLRSRYQNQRGAQAARAMR